MTKAKGAYVDTAGWQFPPPPSLGADILQKVKKGEEKLKDLIMRKKMSTSIDTG